MAIISKKERHIVKKRPQIKTQQQPDTTWKAWAVGTGMVVHAKTKEKAIEMLELVLGNGEKDQTKDFEDLQ
jgi:hypothetical protein